MPRKPPTAAERRYAKRVTRLAARIAERNDQVGPVSAANVLWQLVVEDTWTAGTRRRTKRKPVR
jgi:hypothetical protein